jgi:hypothetical protein
LIKNYPSVKLLPCPSFPLWQIALTSFIPNFEIIESPQNSIDFANFEADQPDHVPKTSPAETLAVRHPLLDNHIIDSHDNNLRPRFRQGAFADETSK